MLFSIGLLLIGLFLLLGRKSLLVFLGRLQILLQLLVALCLQFRIGNVRVAPEAECSTLALTKERALAKRVRNKLDRIENGIGYLAEHICHFATDTDKIVDHADQLA